MPRPKHLARPLLLLTLGALVSACVDTETGAPPPPGVVVENPVRREITESFDYRGSLRSIDTAELRARVAGFVEEILFREGAVVEQGEVLFRIEPQPYRIALDEARAQLADARARAELAQARWRRTRTAREAQAVSEIELLEAKSERDVATAAVANAAAAVQRAELDLDYTEVRSPFRGRAGQSRVDVGNLVGTGEATLLTTVIKTDPIYAFFDTREDIALRYIQRGEQGNPDDRSFPPAFLGLANEEGHPHEGRVDFVDTALNVDTGTLQIRAIFPNPTGELFPGLFVRIRVPFETVTNALLVREDAVSTDLTGAYVLTVDEGDVVRRTPIELGGRYDGFRHVLSGLGADDRYVTRGLQKARPGQPVTPRSPTDG